MLFSSIVFLSLFLPFVLLINSVLSTRYSNIFLLLTSLLFYFYGEGQLIYVLLVSISWNYLFGVAMKLKQYRKALLFVGVSGNLLLLIYYKYALFFLSNIGITDISELTSLAHASLYLPLGISFFTFQGISYIVDGYKNKDLIQKNPIKLGLYIALFPQLIAGPIVKYHELAPYLSKRSLDTQSFSEGLIRFIRGLAKKVIIADQLANLSDYLFGIQINDLSSFDTWIAVLTFSLQIYFDFSAYSDMAIGIGKMLGFTIPENFNYPYLAKSFKDFWRRWHISLSTWFRDYVYIPLGGNRKTGSRTYFNLLIVFFITGLWHGASYNFVIWGMLHGCFLLIDRQNFRLRIPSLLKRIYTFLVVSLLWVFFRTEDLESAFNFYSKLFNLDSSLKNQSFLLLNPYMIFIIILALIFMLPIRKVVQKKLIESKSISPPLHFTLTMIVYLFVLIYSLLEVASTNHNPFIYFKF